MTIKNNKLFTFFFFILIFSSFVSAWNFDVNSVKVSNLPVTENGYLEVQLKEYAGDVVSFFLTRELKKTTLNTNAIIEQKYVILTDSTGCLVGDAIDIYDNDNYFQGIILAVNSNNISFTPRIDDNFSTSDTIVKCGEWNMNVNGAVTPIEYSINPPLNKSWHIESLGMQFKDNADWDINTFGSRTALTNGFVVDVGNGMYESLFLIYNNGGFALRGGLVQNFAKAPSGLYGFTVDMDFETKYGIILSLNGANNEKIVGTIQDDLTSQTEIAFIIRGHYEGD